MMKHALLLRVAYNNKTNASIIHTNIPYATNEIEMPPKKKNKTTQASQQAAAARLPHRIDPVAVQAQWSPNREQRILSVPRQKKIRSAREGPLRGEETDEDEDETPEAQQQQQLPADDTLATNHGDVTKATNQSAGLKTNHGDATLSTDQNQSASLMQFRTVIVAAPEPSYEANLAFQDNSLASFGPVKVATPPDSTE